MRKLLRCLMVVLSCWAGTTNAQLVGVINEEVASGALGGIPAGYSTYRIYALLEDPTDRMSAVFGSTSPSPIHHLKLGSSSDGSVIWNSVVGGATADAVNCFFIGLPGFADLARDSWVTIGSTSSGADACVDCIGVQSSVFTISSPANVIPATFASAGAFGPDLLLVDGAWFLPNDLSCNGYPTGVDNRVVIAQITIPTGTLEYQLNISVFDEAIGAQQMIYVHTLQDPTGNVGEFVEMDGTCLGLVFPIPTAICAGDVPGCTDDTACNYNPDATADDGTCTYPGCTDDTACNYNGDAGCDDGTCTFPGCTDGDAANFDPLAGCDDGSCLFEGCTDVTACNFDSGADLDDGSCTYPGCQDQNACNFNGAAGCPDNSCTYPGCTDDSACNYNGDAGCDDGSCTYPGCTDAAACNFDADAGCPDGSCTYPGCINSIACNFNPNAGCGDNSCTFPGCTDSSADNYDPNAGCDNGSCLYFGCTDQTACNYAAGANSDDGSCTYPGCNNPNANNYDPAAGCDDGSCTFDEFGCTDDAACNFDANATIDDGSCTYPGCNDPAACNFDLDAGCSDGSCTYPTLCGDPTACNYDPTTVGDCSYGECTYPGCTDINACNFTGGGCDDGSCEYVSCAGCTDPSACNYDPTATISTSTCDYSCYGCTDDEACNFDADATIEDGSCDYSCYGCTNVEACNFDPNATIDNGSCDFDCQGCTDDAACNFDPTATEDDGSCDYSCFGCTEADACNFDDGATIDDGSCDYSCLGCTDDSACNFDAGATIDDGSCTYPGCTDDSACNFNANAGCEDGSCTYPGCTNPDACNYNANAGCNDGSCTFPGCTDDSACNYNGNAGCDDGSCTYPGCTNEDACNYDADAGCNDGSCTFPGCTNDAACNYNGNAGCDNGSCTFPGCTDPNALNYDADAGCDDGSCEYDPNQCFFICPGDAWVQCGDSTDPDATGSAFYEGGCQSIVNYTDSETEGDACHYWFTRTWCGNQFIIFGVDGGGGCDSQGYNDLDGDCADSVCSYDSFCCEVAWDSICANEAASDENCNYCLGGGIDCDDTCEQIIHVHDTEAPVFNPEPADITVTCEDLVPPAGDCVATDNCSEEIIYDIFTSETGECIETCTLSVAYGPGPDWSVWLPELAVDGLAAGANYVWSSDAYLVMFADGTAHLWGDVVNTADAGQGWHVNMWFENAVDWAAWSALGRSYKDDLNLATPGSLYLDWTFLELVNGFSTLTGLGDFTGSALYLEHFPYDYYYGFQCGWAANNKNSNYGMSGWFAYTGWVDGEAVAGNGDLNVDKSCIPCDPLDCPHADGEVTYFWMATDECGNVAFTDQVVTIWDDVEPVFENCPEDVWVDCYEDALLVEIPATNTLYGYDNCDPDVLMAEMLGDGPVYEGNDCDGSLTYTWFVEDCNGNRDYCEMTIHWNDETDPEFTYVPGSYTIECDLPIVWEDATATDNCGDATVTSTSVWGGNSCYGWWTVYFTAMDECGNTATATQIITVVDTTAPVFSGDNTITIECSELDNVPAPVVTDACNAFEVWHTDICVSGGCPGGLQRTYYAEDICGNQSSWIQYITIFDNTPPVIVAPAELDAECDDIPEPEASAYDACEYQCLPEYDIEVNSTSVIVPGDCENSYDIVITWSAVDYCENIGYATTIIHVYDTTDPEFTYCPPSYEQECDEPYPTVDEASADDNCDEDVEIIVTDEIEPGDCIGEYTIVRIYRAYDNCGNEAMCVQYIYIYDNTAPEFTYVPDDITVECDDDIPYEGATAEDNCGTTEVTYSDYLVNSNCTEQGYNDLDGACAASVCSYDPYCCDVYWDSICVSEATSDENCAYCEGNGGCDEVGYADLDGPCAASVCSYDSFCCDVAWDSICADEAAADASCAYCVDGDPCLTVWCRVFTATDDCGNSGTAMQFIYIVDTTAPVITANVEVSVPCDEYSSEVGYLTATDNCNEITITWTDEEVSGTCEGHYIRDYVVCDICGNCSYFQQIITLTDDIDPTIVCQPDFTVECGNEYSAPWYEASDNCDDDVEVTSSATSTTDGCTTWVTYCHTAYDNCGNTASCCTIVTIVDTTPPTVYPPSGNEFSCDEDIVYGTATASDICDEVVDITYSDVTNPGECPQSYTIVRTWYGTDDCGNVGYGFTTYYVYDNEAPEFTYVPDDITVECDEDIPFAWATAEDNCGETTVVYNDYLVNTDCDEVGYNDLNGACATSVCSYDSFCCEVSWDSICADEAASDENCAYCVNDGGCDEVGYADLDGPCAASVCSYDSFCCETAWDSICADEAASDDNCAYCVNDPCTTVWCRVFTATDECDNSSTAMQFIYIVDTTAPVITANVEVSVPCDEYSSEVGYLTATDNCNEITITWTDEEVSGTCEGHYIRDYVVCDICGNCSYFQQIITLTDDIDPTIVCQPDFTVECGNEYSAPWYEASDNCDDDVEVTSSATSTTDGCTTWVTYCHTAYDNCGNTASCCTIVTIVDTTPPTVYPPSGNEFSCDEDIVYGTATASDICDEVVDITYSDVTNPGECPQSYTIVRTWYGTDDCGNVGYGFTTYYVYDNEAPEFTYVPDDITVECDEDIPFAWATAEDNCGETTVVYNDYLVNTNCDEVGYNDLNGACATSVCSYDSFCCEVSWDSICADEAASDENCAYCVNDGGCDEVGYADLDGPCAASVCSYDSFCCETAWDSICANEAAADASCAYCVNDPCTTVWCRVFTATDECDNSSTAMQFITIVDTTAPVIAGEVEVFVPCDEYNQGIGYITATDNCNEYTIIWTDEEVSATCEGHYIRDYVVCDICGNCSYFQQIITLTDDIDPTIVCQPDFTVECGNEYSAPWYEASDNCDDDVEVTSSATSTTDGCTTWVTYCHTAHDNCSNSASCCTIVTIVDTTPPTVYPPSGNEFSCDEDIVYGTATAYDTCDEIVDITYSDVIIPSECPQEYTIVRTWYGTDNCGNVGTGTTTYYVYDNEAPVLVGCPEDLELDCEDEIPAPATVTAIDNCDPNVVVSYEEYCYGECPEPGQGDNDDECDLITPAFPAVDSDCNYPVNWAMVLFNVPSAYKYYQVDTSYPATFVDNGDGTATITAKLFNVSNPDGGFFVSVLLESGMDWTAFDNLPYYTNYKSDCVDVGLNYLDWIYYYMSNTSTLTGWGDYETSLINMSHAPSNLAFGYQLGLGANNQNENYGSGGWFTHDGVIVDDSTENEFEVGGAGDLSFEHDCCNDYTIVRQWSAHDCAGNFAITCEQTITVGNGGEAVPPVVDPGVENPGIEKPIVGNFDIMGVSPNPAVNQTTVEFVAVANNTLTMDVYDMAGRKIAELFHGNVEAGQTYKVSFNTQFLEDGLYNIRLFSLNDAKVKRLIIAR